MAQLGNGDLEGTNFSENSYKQNRSGRCSGINENEYSNIYNRITRKIGHMYRQVGGEVRDKQTDRQTN